MRTTNDALRSLARYVAIVLLAYDSDFEVWLDYEQMIDLEPPFAVVGASGAETTVQGKAGLADRTQPFYVHVYPRPQETVVDSEALARDLQELLWTAFEMGFSYSDVQTQLPVPTGITIAQGSTGGSLTPFVPVYYRVAAVDVRGETLPSLDYQGVPGTNRSLVVSWAAVLGATKYRVYRADSPGAEVADMFEVTPATLSDSGGAGSATYPPAQVRSAPRRVPLYDHAGLDLTQRSYARNPHDYMRVASHSEQRVPEPQDPRRIRIVADLRMTWRQLTKPMVTAQQATAADLVFVVEASES